METISPEFSARLARREPNEMVRLIVLADTSAAHLVGGRRGAAGQRQTAIAAVRAATAAVAHDIDQVLGETGGTRLTAEAGPLGTFVVETTVAGANALAALDGVRAILEDQSISAVR